MEGWTGLCDDCQDQVIVEEGETCIYSAATGPPGHHQPHQNNFYYFIILQDNFNLTYIIYVHTGHRKYFTSLFIKDGNINLYFCRLRERETIFSDYFCDIQKNQITNDMYHV